MLTVTSTSALEANPTKLDPASDRSGSILLNNSIARGGLGALGDKGDLLVGV